MAYLLQNDFIDHWPAHPCPQLTIRSFSWSGCRWNDRQFVSKNLLFGHKLVQVPIAEFIFLRDFWRSPKFPATLLARSLASKIMDFSSYVLRCLLAALHIPCLISYILNSLVSHSISKRNASLICCIFNVLVIEDDKACRSVKACPTVFTLQA